ncbi:21767_t:CDS:2 [Dentiscutata erythropus]|uniref:21767_t:CDS:1 n=1 Tax=Dentiscutata erythropus TaxID=1348616 RepID=A0A9N9GV83_9GLOM|nr:21767_t:CDS:2 [Dentiscutata erythropus]
MDRTSDQRRTSSPTYNRPRDTTPYRSNSTYSERDNYSSSHYIPSRSYSQNPEYSMREPPQGIPRYEGREEESQLAFRGQVPYVSNSRDLKPYGRPPLLPPQSYDRRPPYRGGTPYNIPHPRQNAGGPPPHNHRDFGGPPYNPPYSRGSPIQHHPPYQRPPFHTSPFPPAAPRPPSSHQPLFPLTPTKPTQNPISYAPALEEKIAQSKERFQQLREEEFKLTVDLHKRRGELNKATWELTKVTHNTALALQQIEVLYTPEQIEALVKEGEENAERDAMKNHC